MENVQIFALRVSQKDWRSSFTALLNKSKLSLLSCKRSQLRLILLYKIKENIVNYPLPPIEPREPRCHRTRPPPGQEFRGGVPSLGYFPPPQSFYPRTKAPTLGQEPPHAAVQINPN